MIRLFAMINTLLGSALLALYCFKVGGDVVSSSNQEFLILGISLFCLISGVIGFKRFSILCYFGGFISFMAIAAKAEISRSSNCPETLRAFIESALAHGPMTFLGVGLISLGMFLDQLKKTSHPPAKSSTKKSEPQIEDKPKTEDKPDKKIVKCSCGKKMRVKISSKKFRCPNCQKILSAQ